MNIRMVGCKDCPTLIVDKPNCLYCEPCRLIRRAQTTGASNARHAADRKLLRANRAAITLFESTLRKSSITRAEQLKINLVVDTKYACQTTTKLYKPGTAEFMRIAATITPLRNVRTGISSDRESILAETEGRPIFRRRETVDGL